MQDIIRFDWDSVEQLLPLVEGFINDKKAGEELNLFDTANQVANIFGIENIEALIAEKTYDAIEEGLGIVFDGEGAAEIASIFAKICVPVTKQVYQYAQGDLTASSFINQLEAIRTTNISEIQNVLQSMLAVPDETADLLAKKFDTKLISIYCFYATYKIYEKAVRDAALAHERRMEAEQLCSEAIARLKAERIEMEEMVNSYMLGRLLPFGEGVAAMDKAIIENDDEGFVRANVGLWEVFGRSPQYNSVEEFDGLMLSDEAFRL